MRAMRLAPAERYQTADEMLVDVERVLRTEFQSAGQTELKLWLEQLARRDGSRASASSASTRAASSRTSSARICSAGTSFELDEVQEITSGMTELALTPPPLVRTPGVARPETTVERAPRGRRRRPCPRRRS